MPNLNYTILETSLDRSINLLPSSDSLFIASYAKSKNSRLIIITKNSFDSRRINDEVKLFDPELKIKILQNTEILPYEKAFPQKEVIAERLRTLWQVFYQQLDILIVEINTLQTKICPPQYLIQRMLLLKVGAKLPVTDLKEKLVSADYLLVEQVLEPGEFAVRGSIIDILPMGSTNLIRIELFDNEIEKLQELEVTTKEILRSVSEIEIIPTREYPIDQETAKNFINQFNKKFPNHSDNHIIKNIQHGIFPAGSEFYLPLFFDNLSSLFDYISPNNWEIISYKTICDDMENNWNEIESRHDTLRYQYPCLNPHELFISKQETLDVINQFKHLTFNVIQQSDNHLIKLPDITINSKSDLPLKNLQNFINNFNGILVVVANGIGRIQIIKETLINNNLDVSIIKSLSEESNNKILLINGYLQHSFILDKIALISEYDLYSGLEIKVRKYNNNRNNQFNKANSLTDLSEISIGDYIVHINHGIGKYLGLTKQIIDDIEYEMLELEYQDNAKLFVPIQNLYLISRYSKPEETEVTTSKLGSSKWNNLKQKAQKRINDTAAELLKLYAEREAQVGNKFVIPPEYEQFCQNFGYTPTLDQETSFNEIIKDMTNLKPMDRLICGDVGFGKTEVAIRAAFICAMNGKQVAILTPTTLLTEQHYQNFVNRFSSFPIKVREISRFRTKKEIDQTLEQVKSGDVDILVGTHRLLQNDINFANLGLIIIDEEHRFGVKQKEKLKQLKANVDFLAMTATPIPRTLSMALDGLRSFSIIATPPSRRLPINTITSTDDASIIKEAILRETRRGGQVFFLYNDVATIIQMYDKLTKLMPDLSIAIAHGQMNEHNLEVVIRDFIQQKYNLLLCSTIIETGIDIPNANTIIIYRADKFGLANLYQLRGRVGRSHHQAYCYLIIPENITNNASKRLDAIEMTSELGSGFSLALNDLEIRGAGEILGEKQSGDIKEIGLSLYTSMLKKTIKKLKSGELGSNFDPESHCEINLHATAIIPDKYCPNIPERLLYYKKLTNANSTEDIDLIYQDIIDKHGLPPEPVKLLIQSNYLRIKAEVIGVSQLNINEKSITLIFIDNPPIEPIKMINLLQKHHNCRFDGKNKLTYSINVVNNNEQIKHAHDILDQLINH